MRRYFIASPDDPGRAEGFGELLRQHGITVSVVKWKAATAERAGAFDLVIVTGKSRSGAAPLDVSKPVLGIGPFAYGYFGKTDLKHGYPYS